MINKKVKKYLITFLAGIVMGSAFLMPTTIYGDATKTSSKEVIDTGKATIDGISVRSTNSASGTYLGSLKTGDNVEIVEKTSNGWYKIKYNKSYAYVSEGFIKLAGTETIDNTLNTGVVYNAGKLTVRESCSTKSKFLGYLPKDTKVYIVRATSTNWYKIKYENSYAYVKSEYIKLTSSVEVISRGSVTGEYINIRKSPSTKSEIMGTLNKDARVVIVKKELNNWYKIRYRGQYGYVTGDFIKVSDSNRKNLNDFLFVGDSFTARMENTIKSNNEAVYVHAQGGSRSSYWLDKVDEMPDKNLVDSVSILIGVNGVTTPKNVTNTKALINQLIVKYPDKTIYVQKVFPVGSNFTEGKPDEYNDAITEYNKQLKAFCETKDNVKIIDATTNFVDNKGYLTNTSDGLHIDEVKNNDFYNNIFNAIEKTENDK